MNRVVKSVLNGGVEEKMLWVKLSRDMSSYGRPWKLENFND